MKFFPTKVELIDENTLQIEWNDGQRLGYSVRGLRERCPCATCREKNSEQETTPTLLPVLSPAETQPTRIVGMRPIGNYAYGIQFSDGHDTGIFSLDLLREIGVAVD